MPDGEVEVRQKTQRTSAAVDGTSARLLERAREGDSQALSMLLRRHLPGLQRWAHGRLPRWLRTMADTADLVQTAVLNTIRRLPAFEPRGQRALGAYLRESVLHQIADEHRRFGRRGAHEELFDTPAIGQPSPFDQAAFAEIERRYRRALDTLKPADRELVVAHIELGYTHQQLACMTGKRVNAARMALRRALDRLADAVGHG